MVNLKKVSPITLEGDMGWDLRHNYNEISEELKRCTRLYPVIKILFTSIYVWVGISFRFPS